MNIAIIPARGGSKRIPRKNIKQFQNKPMIAYAIKAAIESEIFDDVYVSTDDDEIQEIALKHHAKVPFKRPTELSDDITPTVPVITHAIQYLEEQGGEFDNVCCIYPAVPFIQIEDIRGAFKLLNESKLDYTFPIAEFPSAVQRAFTLGIANKIAPMQPENELKRTQDLTTSYYDAGQFYWGSCESWKKNNRIHSNAAGYVIPSWRVVDIDTIHDWQRAEIFYEAITKFQRRD
jgi:pseudaminic acid cytidylyltransferase